MLKNSSNRYGTVSKGLHWGIALLVVGQIWLAITAFGSTDTVYRESLLAIHRPLGVTIMTLMMLRLAWRLANPTPDLPAGMSAAGRGLALTSHATFYLLLVFIALVGWVKAGAENIAVNYFGWFVLPSWTVPDEALARSLRATHLYLNTALLALIGLHALAALRHQFWLKDGALVRMLPGGYTTRSDGKK